LRAGELSYESALSLTRYLASERDYLPWRAATTALNYLDIMLFSSSVYDEWQRYLSELVIPLYNEVGFDEKSSDTHLLMYTRVIASEWACKLGNRDCIQKANGYYNKWMRSENAENVMSPNQRRLISCTAIENGGEEEWNFAKRIYLNSASPAEKKDLLSAMSCTKQPNILTKMLEMMIDSSSGVRLQDATELFTNVASNPLGNQIALNFLSSRWNDIDKYFQGYAGFGGGVFPTLFQSICNRVNSKNQIDQLLKLYDNHADVLNGSEAAQQGIEVAKSNLQWVTANYNAITEWLDDNASSTTPSTPTEVTTPSTPTTTDSSANYLQHSVPILVAMLSSLLLI